MYRDAITAADSLAFAMRDLELMQGGYEPIMPEEDSIFAPPYASYEPDDEF